LILDDLSYVSKDQAETSVLFEFIGVRYERRSTLITANEPFGGWDKVFPDPAMTLAAVNRLVRYDPRNESRKRPSAAALERKSAVPIDSHRARQQKPSSNCRAESTPNRYLRATINPAMIPVAANMPKHPDCRSTAVMPEFSGV
jgi:hypothetical protein